MSSEKLTAILQEKTVCHTTTCGIPFTFCTTQAHNLLGSWSETNCTAVDIVNCTWCTLPLCYLEATLPITICVNLKWCGQIWSIRVYNFGKHVRNLHPEASLPEPSPPDPRSNLQLLDDVQTVNFRNPTESGTIPSRTCGTFLQKVPQTWKGGAPWDDSKHSKACSSPSRGTFCKWFG